MKYCFLTGICTGIAIGTVLTVFIMDRLYHERCLAMPVFTESTIEHSIVFVSPYELGIKP